MTLPNFVWRSGGEIMLSGGQNAFVIVASLVVSMALVAILNRYWPVTHRKLVNDVTGWQLGVLGTSYGVILGFMLSTVWSDFHNAELNVSQEAASLMNAYNISAELPAPNNQIMRDLARQYGDAVVNEEWPAMQQSHEVHTGGVILGKMWEVLHQSKASEDGATNSVDHLTTVMSNLSERRNQRELQNAARLPRLLWVLLILGGVATVVSSCALGNDSKWLHYCQVLALTFVVSVALAAIADLARPFQGSVSVSPASFEHVLEVMHGQVY
jgi:hypothetical protein